jgi:hypothetical protein
MSDKIKSYCQRSLKRSLIKRSTRKSHEQQNNIDTPAQTLLPTFESRSQGPIHFPVDSHYVVMSIYICGIRTLEIKEDNTVNLNCRVLR